MFKSKPKWFLSFLPLATSGAVLIVCTAWVVWMALMVQGEIDALSTTNSDAGQWTLGQSEVELLRLRVALNETQNDPEVVTELRRRFDVFYSRMSVMKDGYAFRSLRTVPEFEAPRQRTEMFLTEATPLIDGPDKDLFAELPELITKARLTNADVRAFSLAALKAFSERAEKRRRDLMVLLSGLAVIIILLLAGLSILSMTMFRLFRVAQTRAAEVQQAGERMNTVVETSPLGIVVADETGTIREFNRAAEEIFDYDRSEAIGQKAVKLLVPPEDREENARRLEKFVEVRHRLGLVERQFEFTASKRCGERFPAEISIDRAAGSDPIFVAYVQDISSRKQAEDHLLHARDQALAGERSKSEFLAVMSHEMRTPLNGLLGTIQLMEDEALSDRQRCLITRMDTSGRQLLGLVNDVLDLAKYEAGKMQAENEQFSLPDMLNEVVGTARPMADHTGNELNWHWSGHAVGGAIGDERRIRQILLNLVSNAVKFTRDGNITITARWCKGEYNGGDWFEFHVADTGIGISKENLARIFNDFETLDSSYARQADGTGLGLGIARRLARLMGGEIGADSEPGHGSVFWLRLPLVAANEPAKTPSTLTSNQTSRPHGNGLDVLVVEDNETNRFIAKRMLEKGGHRVEEAENGQIGVDLAAERKFDAILMDISMPVMDGTEAAILIRNGAGASRHSPIVALTAHALPEEQARFRKLGMSACLSKPVNRKQLLQTLAEVTAVSVEDA